VSGHSQNENDTTHSVIERAASKMTVYTTAQWETLILSAFKKQKPVIECLSHSDVIDFKSDYFTKFSKMMRSNVYDINGQRIYWSKIMQLKVERNEPATFLFKYAYEESEFHKFSVNSRVKLNFQKLPKLYKTAPGTSIEKKNDLQKLCSRGIIPLQHHAFFSSLSVASN